MPMLNIEVDCINCDEPIRKQILHIGEENPAVNVHSFSQTSWICSECGHTTCIGDIDMIDKEDL